MYISLQKLMKVKIGILMKKSIDKKKEKFTIKIFPFFALLLVASLSSSLVLGRKELTFLYF